MTGLDNFTKCKESDQITDWDMQSLVSLSWLLNKTFSFGYRRDDANDSQETIDKFSQIVLNNHLNNDMFKNIFGYDLYKYLIPPLPNHPDDCVVFDRLAGEPTIRLLADNEFRLLYDTDFQFELNNNDERVRLIEASERQEKYITFRQKNARKGTFKRRVLVEKNCARVLVKRTLHRWRERALRNLLSKVTSVASELKQGQVLDITSFEGIDFSRPVSQQDLAYLAQCLDTTTTVSLGLSYPFNSFLDGNEPIINIKENVFDRARFNWTDTVDEDFIIRSKEREEFDNSEVVDDIIKEYREVITSKNICERHMLIEKYIERDPIKMEYKKNIRLSEKELRIPEIDFI